MYEKITLALLSSGNLGMMLLLFGTKLSPDFFRGGEWGALLIVLCVFLGLVGVCLFVGSLFLKKRTLVWINAALVAAFFVEMVGAGTLL